jgi:uracil phosphoribosyltransferase
LAVPFHLVDHPLAQDALAELRDSRTPPPAFRAAARRISLIVAAEALRDIPTETDTVSTPIGYPSCYASAH